MEPLNKTTSQSGLKWEGSSGELTDWALGEMGMILKEQFSNSLHVFDFSTIHMKLTLEERHLTPIDDESTLVEVMARRCQATSHNLNQCRLDLCLLMVSPALNEKNIICKDYANKICQFVHFWRDFASSYKGVSEWLSLTAFLGHWTSRSISMG